MKDKRKKQKLFSIRERNRGVMTESEQKKFQNKNELNRNGRFYRFFFKAKSHFE